MYICNYLLLSRVPLSSAAVFCVQPPRPCWLPHAAMLTIVRRARTHSSLQFFISDWKKITIYWMKKNKENLENVKSVKSRRIQSHDRIKILLFGKNLSHKIVDNYKNVRISLLIHCLHFCFLAFFFNYLNARYLFVIVGLINCLDYRLKFNQQFQITILNEKTNILT